MRRGLPNKEHSVTGDQPGRQTVRTAHPTRPYFGTFSDLKATSADAAGAASSGAQTCKVAPYFTPCADPCQSHGSVHSPTVQSPPGVAAQAPSTPQPNDPTFRHTPISFGVEGSGLQGPLSDPDNSSHVGKPTPSPIASPSHPQSNTSFSLPRQSSIQRVVALVPVLAPIEEHAPATSSTKLTLKSDGAASPEAIAAQSKASPVHSEESATLLTSEGVELPSTMAKDSLAASPERRYLQNIEQAFRVPTAQNVACTNASTPFSLDLRREGSVPPDLDSSSNSIISAQRKQIPLSSCSSQLAAEGYLESAGMDKHLRAALGIKRASSMGEASRPQHSAEAEKSDKTGTVLRGRNMERSPCIETRTIGTQTSHESLCSFDQGLETGPPPIPTSVSPLTTEFSKTTALPSGFSSCMSPPSVTDSSISCDECPPSSLANSEVLAMSPGLQPSGPRGVVPLSERRAKAKALGALAIGGDLSASALSDTVGIRHQNLSKAHSFISDDSRGSSSKGSLFQSQPDDDPGPASDEEVEIALRRAEEDARYERQRHVGPIEELAVPPHAPNCQLVYHSTSNKAPASRKDAQKLVEVLKRVTSNGNQRRTGGTALLPVEIKKTVVTTVSVVELASRALRATSPPRNRASKPPATQSINTANINTGDATESLGSPTVPDGGAAEIIQPMFESTISERYQKTVGSAASPRNDPKPAAR